VRIRYASRLYFPEKNYEAVLMVITPLITRDDPPREALGYALASLIEAKLFERALQCLEKLQGEEMGHRSGIAKLRGDLLLALGRLDEAIACYQEESRRDDFVAKFIGIFSHAWALILKGQMGLALSLAQSGANLWFDRVGKFEGYGAFDSKPICIGRTHIGDESPALHVKYFCESLPERSDDRGSLCAFLPLILASSSSGREHVPGDCSCSFHL
jgi:tetratricopeptide (TPR) repeat protein